MTPLLGNKQQVLAEMWGAGKMKRAKSNWRGRDQFKTFQKSNKFTIGCSEQGRGRN
jgi:hypothetical protein